jgi:hypothetical protein
MPDPTTLKVGDRIRFIALPDEWSREGHTVLPEDRSFMKVLIKRARESRVAEIDEYGRPWIHARLRVRGRLQYHSWLVVESSGWRLVQRRGRLAR